MEITANQMEALKEIGNIGSGHAATSLSKLLQARIKMTVPMVWLVSLTQIDRAIGDLDALKVVLYIKVEGGAPGKAMFILPLSSAQKIAKKLLQLPGYPDIFRDEMAQSALNEVGNILVSSFLIALTQFSGVPLQPSPPALAMDMIGALLDEILIEEGEVDDQILIIDTKLTGYEDIEGKFLFIPDKGSLAKLLGVFGI